MAVSAQAQPASAQTIEAYVGAQLDNARMGPTHWRVLALVAGGYFFDVIDFTIFGALVPDIIKSGFATAYQVSWIGFATLIGLGIGTLGQGEFTDRFGRKAVYQFNLLLFGLASTRASGGCWCFASSPVSGSARSSRCASPIPPNTRRRTSAAASSR